MAGNDPADALVERLVAEVAPVHRLWGPGRRLAGWLAVLSLVAAALAIAGTRPDLAARLTAARFDLELLCLLAAAVAAAWVALCGAIPGLDDRRGRLALAGTLTAGLLLGLVRAPAEGGESLAAFVARGVPCTVHAALLALVPWIALSWAVARGLALRAARAFVAAGLAAWIAAYLLMRLRCPSEEAAHLAVWHALPIVFGVAVSAAVGLLLARRRRCADLP